MDAGGETVLTFAAGFTADDAAARLGPLSTGFTVRKVRFFFDGAAPADSVNLIISDDPGTDAPGNVLYAHVYTLTPSDVTIQEIDVSGQHMIPPLRPGGGPALQPAHRPAYLRRPERLGVVYDAVTTPQGLAACRICGVCAATSSREVVPHEPRLDV